MVLRSLERGLLSSDGMRDGDETPLMKLNVKNEELGFFSVDNDEEEGLRECV
jgi:hypothetical protein